MKIEQLMRPDLQDEYGILKLQNIILNIMKFIHDLCERHQIEYYIIGGTALGAVRHGGFIPWDDDLDIAMTRENYDKFIQVCQEELDSDDFFLQIGRKDWPLYFSKLRLKGTLFDEDVAVDEGAKENRGIFVDVFPLDNASNHQLGRLWQYVCSKLLIADCMKKRRNYQAKGFLKKVIMVVSFPLKQAKIRQFFYRQVTKYKNRKTSYIGDFFEITRLQDASYPQPLWGKPQKITFEKIELYGPEKMHEYLSTYFGNYMQLPPVEKRVCGHYSALDFGNY